MQGMPVRQGWRARDPRENRGGVWEGSHVLDAAPAIPSPTPHGAAGAARVRGPTPQSSLEAAERRRLSKSELSPSGCVSDVRGHPPSKISVVLRAPYLERRVSASQAARRTAEQKARLNSEALKCEKKTSVSGWMRFGTGNGACDTRPHAGRDSPFAWLCRARHRGPRHLSLLSRGGSGLCGTGFCGESEAGASFPPHPASLESPVESRTSVVWQLQRGPAKDGGRHGAPARRRPRLCPPAKGAPFPGETQGARVRPAVSGEARSLPGRGCDDRSVGGGALGGVRAVPVGRGAGAPQSSPTCLCL